jgi:hypothetical protein
LGGGLTVEEKVGIARLVPAYRIYALYISVSAQTMKVKEQDGPMIQPLPPILADP